MNVSKPSKIEPLRSSSPPTTSMADALFPSTRLRVLGLLFGQPDRGFTLTELIGLAAAGTGAVQRELARLVASGLVSSTTTGRSRSYHADRSSPIFEELTGIIEKTSGVAEQIRASLAPIASKLRLAILYGSVAKATDTAASDIDILLVADGLALEDAFAALQSAEKRLGRRVSPTVYTRDEFLRRRSSSNTFLSKVLSGKHVVLVGSEDAVGTAR